MTRARLFLLLALSLLFSTKARAAFSVEEIEFFENRIRPVLAQDCYECHRTGGKKKGGLTLDDREGLLRGGDSGPAIKPGDVKASLLLKAIRHEVEDLEMPKARAKLEDRIIEDFEQWVRMGAPDPRDAPASEQQVTADTDWNAVMKRRKNWWSFQPIKKPIPPENGAKHPIDRFIRAKLAAANLPQANAATRDVLLRRLSFALRGLPPTLEELSGGQSFEQTVDSFLGSPCFGERWARHWMDWYRYADSHGSEGDAAIPFSWRYRDYLIRALNDDVPYDQLLREHLAGDQLQNPRVNSELGLNESALGIAHLRMVFHGFAPTDALEEKIRFTDDEINVVSKAALGLTVSCARCHDHKFDPISQADYYAWYGIFASGTPAMIAVDAPSEKESVRRAKLENLKRQIKSALIDEWSKDVAALPTRLATFGTKSNEFFLPLFDTNALAKWRVIEGQANIARGWNLSSQTDVSEWHRDGEVKVQPAGAFALDATGDSVIGGIFPAGVYSHLSSTKDRAVMISPKFSLNGKYDLWVRVAGDGGSILRYVIHNYPRDGSIYPVTRLSGGGWKWVKHKMDYWEGDRAHVELTTAADQAVLGDANAARSWFGVTDVQFRKQGEPAPADACEFARPILAGLNRGENLTNAYVIALRENLMAWQDEKIDDAGAMLLDQAWRNGLLRNKLEDLANVKSLMLSWREEELKTPVPTRAPGVIETEEGDQPLLVRGNHKELAPVVSRHFLDAIDGRPFASATNARLQLAENLLCADNPLTARVIVNRVWHHLFRRGLVATPDNFGRLGRQPSHPELLDFLAGWFVENGYSIKKLVRFIVTSETWRSSSDISPTALEKDPDNILLSHFSVRRLESEAIRDALLAVSGELKADEMYGAPILTTIPRRSVYLRVKRNDMDPFMSAFDAPAPASATGKRDVTNVPAQSLLLLNDPFVIGLAESWARRGDGESGARIERMFREALGRPPSNAEMERSQKLVQWFVETRARTMTERQQLELFSTEHKERLREMEAAARGRIISKRSSSQIGPKPIAAWDFQDRLRDQVGGMHGTALGEARIENGELILNGKGSYVSTTAIPASLKEKTLEAWVRLSNLEQQGGGVMTIQDLSGNVFDSIVIGEQKVGHWLAGSDFFNRTKSLEGPAETATKENFVHLAITYSTDGTIIAYRNGVPYGHSYRSALLATFEEGKAQVLFGNRHGEAGGNRMLTGAIRKARLYDRALSAEDVQVSFNNDPAYVSREQLLTTMSDEERALFEKTKAALDAAQNQIKELDRLRGLNSEWADLAHAIFNLKEFVYVR